jgi:excinuclease ABC subunit C
VGQCLGPCINNIAPSKYEPFIEQIDNFFKGKPQKIINTLTNAEKKAVKELNFEEAKRNLELIEQIKVVSKEMSLSQNVNLQASQNEDIVGYYIHNNVLAIVIFSYVNGKLLTKHQQIIEIFGELEETLNDYLVQYYYESYNLPKKCYVNLPKNMLKQLTDLNKFNFINPISGKHKSILQTAVINAKNFMNTNYLIYKQHQAQTDKSFEELKQLLGFDNLALINVFDISNIYSGDKAGGMIALDDGKFNKNLYRKFIVKEQERNSDYDSMYEVIKRRYTKVIKDNNSFLPNLIIVDGGLIQVNAAIKALQELNLHKVIPVIGLFKNDRHRTAGIVFPNKKQIILDQYSNLYLYLFNIQEEVHRYTINFFRQKFKDSSFRSILNEIPGLGIKTINKLLSHYDNVANIKMATVNELKQYVSEKLAKLIKAKLN